MDFLNRDEIKAKYGLPAAVLKKHLKAGDEYFSELKIREVVAALTKEGWRPGTKRCFECREYKALREFRPMDYCCRLCRSKRREGYHGGSETVQ